MYLHYSHMQVAVRKQISHAGHESQDFEPSYFRILQDTRTAGEVFPSLGKAKLDPEQDLSPQI